MDRCIALIILLLYFDHVTSVDIPTASELSDFLNQLKNDSSRVEISQLITSQEILLQKIKSTSQELKELSAGLHDAIFDIKHPLQAFRFIRNNSVVLNDILRALSQDMKLYTEVHKKLEEQFKKVKKLESEKLSGFIKGLLVIQWTYNLTAIEMADGNFGSYKTEPLSFEDCQDIMVGSYKDSQFSVGEEWLYACLRKVKWTDLTGLLKSQTRLMIKAAVAAYSAGGNFEAAKWFSEVVYRNKNNRYYKYRLKTHVRKMVFNKDNINNGKETNQSEERLDIVMPARERLNDWYTGTVKKYLVCDRVDNGHPLLIIQPIKREIISREPFIVVFHDIISESRIMSLRQAAYPQLVASTVSKERLVHSQRTSKSMFMFDENIDTSFIYNVIEAVTSLSKKSYEVFQVTNYGIGSYYYCHADFFPGHPYTSDAHDNRIATFMLYMSDVKAGGGTAFTSIPDVIFPKMGSAVFWYNLHPNNTVNVDTMHCACPPVFEDKWVANVWIRRHNNEFTAPCPLDQYKTSWW